MSERRVIVRVKPHRRSWREAIALGALLARITESRLLLVSVFKPDPSESASPTGERQRALQRAVSGVEERLTGLEIEQILLPDPSAAHALSHLARQRLTEAVVVASSSRASAVLETCDARLSRQLNVTASLLDGDTAQALPAASSELDPLVIGSRGSEALHVVLLGNTSGPLLQTARCPLLVVPVQAPSIEAPPALADRTLARTDS